MIAFSSVERIFQATNAGVGPITAEVKDGEWLTLLGASGSGKSTLLRLIAGLEIPSSGKVQTGFSTQEMSYVFQEPALLPWKSTLENVILPLTLRGVSAEDANARAQPWLEKLKLLPFQRARPHELSGGLKMRVSLARALVTEPKLLLLDEPFAALDEPIRIELGMELRHLFQTLRPTVIFVTHSITEGLWLADRVMIFRGKPGQVVVDERINLGEKRTLALRGEPEFLKKVEAYFGVLSS